MDAKERAIRKEKRIEWHNFIMLHKIDSLPSDWHEWGVMKTGAFFKQMDATKNISLSNTKITMRCLEHILRFMIGLNFNEKA